jgi:fermentation-respiration switch protein FrsA (DUF1100 family)
MKKLALTLSLLLTTASMTPFDMPSASAQDMSNGAANFYKSDRVAVAKVTFKNKLGMKVVGNLFVPRTLNRAARSPAIVVGHPMGAVKEQSANLTPQSWPNRASSPCLSTCRSGAKARASRAIPSHRTSTPMTSAPPSTS